MPDGLTLLANRPEAFSEPELAAFAALVASGGQVPTDGLAHKVRQAELLVTISDGDSIVATSAIKTPSDDYRAYQFAEAGSVLDPENFRCEFGYVVVAPSHRNRGLGQMLAEKALSSWGTAPVYATTLIGNAAMHRVLEANGFVRSGAAYPDLDAPDDLLHLFVKTGT
ncbi:MULTISPECIES: GNAT family N-acetyltransferase [Hyphomicrobiales]|jgi:predicted GNAT family N-acyltransferase|uniref:GNAT family N-acetyltransferase n=1 Tax=Hyphomicrobiales TaxID=356 RepID=UPI00037CD64F|nr:MULTISPECIES: GNAT family N-acetyltransferase [Phyllobacteriaceae]MCX8567622.1 GNAT family N-acetyltransferase [Aminobacter sp. MET-1]